MKLNNAIFQARQDRVAEKLAALWQCTWGGMGPYSPFDVYLLREKALIAIVEIRTRLVEHTKYPCVYIDLDKWFHLVQSEVGLGIPAYYVVAFTDGIYSARIGTLPVNHYRVNYRGRSDRPQAANDLCPVIDVPTSQFKKLCESDGIFEQQQESAA